MKEQRNEVPNGHLALLSCAWGREDVLSFLLLEWPLQPLRQEEARTSGDVAKVFTSWGPRLPSERNICPDNCWLPAFNHTPSADGISSGQGFFLSSCGLPPPSPFFLLAAGNNTYSLSIINTHNIRFTEAAWMCVADFLWPFPKEHRESKGILSSSNQHEHHLSPSQSWSAGNTKGASHPDNQTLLGRLWHSRLCPNGSSLVLRWVPFLSHPPRPQADLCVHHIWPLFKTPPQSIS